MCGLSKGVAQILNRLDRKTFNDADQRLFEVRPPKTLRTAPNEKHEIHNLSSVLFWSQAFVIFCGLGINNTMMYNQVKKTWAKQSVALDVGRSYWLVSVDVTVGSLMYAMSYKSASRLSSYGKLISCVAKHDQ